MLDWLRRRLRPDPLDTTYDEAAAAFRERRARALEEAADEADRIRDALADAVDDLERGLDAVASMSHDRDPVADVVDNVVTRRRSLLDGLELPENPEALNETLDAFLEDWSDLSRKEAAVLQQIELPEQYRDAMDAFEGAVDRLDGFMSSTHEDVATARRLEDLVAARREALDEIERLEDEIESLPIEDRREDREALEADLDELREGEVYGDYRELQAREEHLQERRDDVVARVNAGIGKTERGAKKLLYQVEHGDLAVDADTELLRALRDGDTAAVLATDPDDLERFAASLRDAVTGEHVEGSDRERLLAGLSELEAAAQELQDLDEIDDEIDAVRDAIEGHEAPRREEALEDEIAETEGAIERLEDERRRLEDAVEDQREEIERVEREIESVLQEAVRGDVVVEGGDGDRTQP